MKLWQLKKISTGESLNEPQPLPENWNGIFGMNGFKDKIGDLSWRGLEDQGWFEVDVPDTEISTAATKKVVDSQIEHFLKESLQYVAVDNPNITKGERADWMEYRRLLNDISNQSSYPNEIYWPKRPDIE
jgi:hypothetical protein